ncbi:MAG TPA: GntR family transcriptional regulator [Sphingobacterium sp.]|nr:GntR family transcriptional regulator [Sphingobacterium sp.]
MKEDSLAYKAYTEIRKKLLANQLLPGIRLKEDAWSKQLGINRMAIREALTRLLGEQLLLRGEKGGFFVRSFSPKDIQEIKELREILETGAIKLIIQYNREMEVVPKLREICDDYSNMISKGYYSGACEADIKFHETIILEAGNIKLKEIYTASNIPLFHQKIGQAQTDPNDYEITEAEHISLVNAIEKSDFELAKDILFKHFARGESLVLDMIQA